MPVFTCLPPSGRNIEPQGKDSIGDGERADVPTLEPERTRHPHDPLARVSLPAMYWPESLRAKSRGGGAKTLVRSNIPVYQMDHTTFRRIYEGRRFHSNRGSHILQLRV
jgi:hypothetical protein